MLKTLKEQLEESIEFFLQSHEDPVVRANAHRVYLELIDNPAEFTGYTDGTKIYTETSLKLIPGIVFHELGHLLYTWFKPLKDVRESLKEGRGLPELITSNFSDKAKLDEINHALKSEPAFGLFLFNSWKNFTNIVEDSYLERTLLARYSILLCKALVVVRNHHWKNYMPTLEELNSSSSSHLNKMYSLMLSYGKFGKLKRKDNDSLSYPFVIDFIKLKDDYSVLYKTHNKISRAKKTMAFFLEYLYDYVVAEWEAIEKGETSLSDSTGDTSGSDMSESGTSISTGDTSGSDMSEPGTSISSEDMTELEPGEESGGCAGDEMPEESFEGDFDYNGEGTDSFASSEKAEKDMEDFLERVSKLYEIEKSEEALEAKPQASKEVLDGVSKSHFSHEGVKSDITESTSVSEVAYNRVYDTVSEYVDTVANKLKRVFQTLTKNYTKYGLWYGGRLRMNKAHKPMIGDYSRKLVSDPKKDLAVFLLLDESGSMRYDNRIQAVTRAAVLLEAVCRELSIPVAIYGHTETHMVHMLKYRDFDDKESAKYSLPNISSRNNNRDGFALRFALDLLDKRSEEKKICITISDGAPAAGNYGIKEALTDIPEAMKEHPNVSVIAAAIGADKGSIEKIYGEERFLDISNLSNLGETLSEIILTQIM